MRLWREQIVRLESAAAALPHSSHTYLFELEEGNVRATGNGGGLQLGNQNHPEPLSRSCALTTLSLSAF
jgi:hypothetical protein